MDRRLVLRRAAGQLNRARMQDNQILISAYDEVSNRRVATVEWWVNFLPIPGYPVGYPGYRQRSAGADESNAAAKCHSLVGLPPFEYSSQTLTAVKRVSLEHVEERNGEFLSGDCLDFAEVLVHRGLPGMENFTPGWSRPIRLFER